jgi:hypothetical protein
MSPTVDTPPPDKKTEGARLLTKWIKENGGSYAKFAFDAGVERIQVLRVIHGKRWQRITVDFALAVREATGGAISIESWRSSTARLVRK